MIGGKVKNISREDVIYFAGEMGIRAPESIIRKVAESVASFRTLAKKNGVKEEWIGRIETCLSEHLSAWGLLSEKPKTTFTLQSGHSFENVHIETTYKGNYHLLATIDGKALKYIIRKGTPEHDEITETRPSKLTEERIKELVEQFLLPKIENE
jgi:serine/threonine-protein kinase HipA